MRTGRWFHLVAVLAALATGCVAEAPPVDSTEQALGNAHGTGGDVWLDEDELDEVPPCAGLDLDLDDVEIFEVPASGGLFAVAQDGEIICIDDADGLRQGGLGGAPEIELPGDDLFDGTPLPAREPPPSDGTPLPAGVAGGATLVSDGTPLPANPNK